MEVLFTLAPLFFIALMALLVLALTGIAAALYARVAPQGGSNSAQMRGSRQRQQEYHRRLQQQGGAYQVPAHYGVAEDSAFDALPQSEPAAGEGAPEIDAAAIAGADAAEANAKADVTFRLSWDGGTGSNASDMASTTSWSDSGGPNDSGSSFSDSESSASVSCPD